MSSYQTLLSGQVSILPFLPLQRTGIVCFLDDVCDLGIGHSGDLIHQGIRQRLTHLGGHFGGALSNGLQDFFTVQVLRTDYKPKVILSSMATALMRVEPSSIPSAIPFISFASFLFYSLEKLHVPMGMGTYVSQFGTRFVRSAMILYPSVVIVRIPFSTGISHF